FGTLEEITRQLHQLRPLEVLLTGAAAIDGVMEIVRRHVEPGAEITPSPAEAAVRFRTAKSEEELAGLLAALVGAGLGGTQFREGQTDLEEAFMTVARSAEADTAIKEGPRFPPTPRHPAHSPPPPPDKPCPL